MNTARERLLKIINEIPESELAKVLDFAEFIKDREKKDIQRFYKSKREQFRLLEQ